LRRISLYYLLTFFINSAQADTILQSINCKNNEITIETKGNIIDEIFLLNKPDRMVIELKDTNFLKNKKKSF
jgi:hypothetical protein